MHKKNKTVNHSGGSQRRRGDAVAQAGKEVNIMVLGAGPVGLYLVYRLLSANAFSDSYIFDCNKPGKPDDYPLSQDPNCTLRVKIQLYDRNKLMGADDTVLDDGSGLMLTNFKNFWLNESELPGYLQAFSQGNLSEIAPVQRFYDTVEKGNIEQKGEAFNTRRQIFYIRRDVLKNMDPLLRDMVRQLGCGTSSTPWKWGIARCIVDFNDTALAIGAAGMENEPGGMEFPAVDLPENVLQDFSTRMTQEQKDSLKSTNLADETEEFSGGIQIEIGMLQLCLLICIKTRLRQMLGDAMILRVMAQIDSHGQYGGSCKDRGNCGQWSFSMPSQFKNYGSCADTRADVSPGSGGRNTCDSPIEKYLNLNFGTKVDEDQLKTWLTNGNFDFVFNASGKTLLADQSVRGICSPVSVNIPANKSFDSKSMQEAESQLIKDETTDEDIYCKQYGTVLSLKIDEGNRNCSDSVIAALARLVQRDFEPRSRGSYPINKNFLNKTTPSKIGIMDYSRLMFAQQKGPLFMARQDHGYDLNLTPAAARRTAELLKLTGGTSQLWPGWDAPYAHQNDVRIFLGRGDGTENSSNYYVGLLITKMEQDALEYIRVPHINEDNGTVGEQTGLRKGLTRNGKLLHYTDTTGPAYSEDGIWNINTREDLDTMLSYIKERRKHDALWNHDQDIQKFYSILVNGVILKILYYMQEHGVSPYSVDILHGEFGSFPLTLRNVAHTGNPTGYGPDVADIATRRDDSGQAATAWIWRTPEGVYDPEGRHTMLVQIGDAAYSAHYFSGAGVNNGMIGVEELIKLLRYPKYIPPTNFQEPNDDIWSHVEKLPSMTWARRMVLFREGWNTYINNFSEWYIRHIQKDFGSAEAASHHSDLPGEPILNVPLLGKYNENDLITKIQDGAFGGPSGSHWYDEVARQYGETPSIVRDWNNRKNILSDAVSDSIINGSLSPITKAFGPQTRPLPLFLIALQALTISENWRNFTGCKDSKVFDGIQHVKDMEIEKEEEDVQMFGGSGKKMSKRTRRRKHKRKRKKTRGRKGLGNKKRMKSRKHKKYVRRKKTRRRMR